MERKRYPKKADELVLELNKAKEEGHLESTLIEIFSMHEMDMLSIWSCRSFFRALPDEFYVKNVMLIPFRSLIEAMSGNLEEAKRIAGFFGRDFLDIKTTGFNLYDLSIVMLDQVLPQTTPEEFAERVAFLMENISFSVPGLALTACRPSVINGFRDVTNLGSYIKDNRESVENQIYMLYGKSGRGVYDVALAEWSYETNKGFEALLLVAGTIPTLDNADDIRCLVAAYILQMRILILNGQDKCSDELFAKIFSKIEEKNFEEMERSLHAARCLFACYDGNKAEIDEWLEKYAPNENDEMFMMDIFSYMVKMRCYLQTGRYMMTSLLAKRLMEMLSHSYRPHDMCECYLISAMACLKAGDKEKAVLEFINALEIGLPLGYFRIFADEGQMMLDLIALYRDYKKKQPNREYAFDDSKIRKIKEAATEIARRFPAYLSSFYDIMNSLTQTEKKVLVHLVEGLTNEEIAVRLGKNNGAIKFHTSGIYRKLRVENRQQAINVARALGLV